MNVVHVTNDRASGSCCFDRLRSGGHRGAVGPFLKKKSPQGTKIIENPTAFLNLDF